MMRSVPNYTCKKNDETGVTCIKVILDGLDNKPVYEKEINDLSAFAEAANKKLTKESSWKTPIIYDLALFALESNKSVKVVKESDSHVQDPVKDMESYSKKREAECIAKGLVKEINPEILESLERDLRVSPVILFMNANSLYKQPNAGFIWLVVLEYNSSLEEFIVYDPLYYSRMPASKNWERIPNTPKKRYISFKKNYFLENWIKTSQTKIFSVKIRNKGEVKPFIREYLFITSKDTSA